MQAITEAQHILNTSLAQFPSLAGFRILVSGGDDSLATLAIAATHPQFKGVIHVLTMRNPITMANTAFIKKLCADKGYDLIITEPATTYTMLTVKYGFPGPASHRQMYQMLKERPLRQAKKIARKRDGGKIAFVTGVRRLESDRRMLNAETVQKNSEGIWIAPIINMTKPQTLAVREYLGLPANPLSKHIRIGNKDCWCGSYASAGEKEEAIIYDERMRQWFEQVQGIVTNASEYQSWLSQQNLDDQRIEDKQTVWGWSAYEYEITGQMKLWDDNADMMLCRSCETKQAPTEAEIETWLEGA